METYGFDTGQIAIIAIAILVGCLALSSWIRRPKGQTGETEVLVQIRNELRDANASLRQLKDAAQHQQSTLEQTTATLEAMRGNANDHASDVKSAIETVSGAMDAARAEGTARHETTSEAIETVRTTAAEAQEKANDAYLAANGLRRKIDEINEQVGGIPQLRNGMDRLQQGVNAIAAIGDQIPTLGTGIENLQQSLTAIAETKPKKGRGRTTTTRQRNNKGGGKTDPGGTPANAAAQPSDAGKPAETTPESEAAPQTEARTAAAPATDSSEPGTRDGDSAPNGQQTESASESPDKPTPERRDDATDEAARAATGTDGEPAQQVGESAGNGTPDGGATPARTGHEAEQAPPADPGTAGAEQQEQATR